MQTTQWEHGLTENEILDLMQQAMEIEGLIFGSDDLPLHIGKTKYVKTDNRSVKKRKARSGWYSVYLGEFPCVKFGWMHGDNPSFTWKLFDYMKQHKKVTAFHQLSEEEQLKKELQRKKQYRLNKESEKEDFLFSRALSVIEAYRVKPLSQNHPYLIKKKFHINECQNVFSYNQTPFTVKEIKTILSENFPEYLKRSSRILKLMDYQEDNIKFRGDNLILFGQTIDNQICMYQLIFNKKNKANKDKHFPSSIIKHQSYHRIGKPFHAHLTEQPKGVILCEGWATGISLNRFLTNRVSILVCWDCHNMLAVAKKIRATFSTCKIYIANDNDHTKTIESNAGYQGALRVCNAVGGYIVSPPFDSKKQSHKDLSDWNDFENLMSSDFNLDLPQIRKYFIQAMNKAKYRPPILQVEHHKLIKQQAEQNVITFTQETIEVFKELGQLPFSLFYVKTLLAAPSGKLGADYLEYEKLLLINSTKILCLDELDLDNYYRIYDLYEKSSSHLQEMMNFQKRVIAVINFIHEHQTQVLLKNEKLKIAFQILMNKKQKNLKDLSTTMEKILLIFFNEILVEQALASYRAKF